MVVLARMLAEFHCALGQEPGHRNAALRATLHREEHGELEDELCDPHTAEPYEDDQVDRMRLARELADVVYMCYGTAHAFAIDLDVALAEIHRAAMSKVGPGMVVREDGKALRPPGFVGPDMTEAVGL